MSKREQELLKRIDVIRQHITSTAFSCCMDKRDLVDHFFTQIAEFHMNYMTLLQSTDQANKENMTCSTSVFELTRAFITLALESIPPARAKELILSQLEKQYESVIATARQIEAIEQVRAAAAVEIILDHFRNPANNKGKH